MVTVGCWCRTCQSASGEDRFVVSVPEDVENAIAGDPELNPKAGTASRTGIVRCPKGHVWPADDAVIEGDPKDEDLPVGTWTEGG
jgi:hypothetical protein